MKEPPCPWGTTKHENATCHSGPDPESRCRGLDTGLRRYDDLFSYKQLQFSLFIVWIIISAVVLVILVIPFVLSADSVHALTPECESKQKYGKECPLCGMTTSFIYISKGNFQPAHLSNSFSGYLYLLFVINEFVMVCVLSRKNSLIKQKGGDIWTETLLLFQ